MRDNLHFRGPGFEFKAAGPIAIIAAVCLIYLLVRVV
jgi:hypothetical protein